MYFMLQQIKNDQFETTTYIIITNFKSIAKRHEICLRKFGLSFLLDSLFGRGEKLSYYDSNFKMVF